MGFLTGGLSLMNFVSKILFVLLVTLYGIPLYPLHEAKHNQTDHFIVGMVGKQPKLLCWLMHQFKQSMRGNAFFLNRLLLDSTPGNGKSTLAKKFAQETDSIFIARSACSMVERYVGQGAANVIDMFTKARELGKQHGKKIVIFIDEIDALASSNDSEFRAEHKAALQQLWIELDACKEDPTIFIICATNEFKKLSNPFLDRFGCNTLEIPNPDETLCKQVLNHFFDKAHVAINPTLLNELASKSKELSIRSLEDMVYGIKMAADLDNNGKVSSSWCLWKAPCMP